MDMGLDDTTAARNIVDSLFGMSRVSSRMKSHVTHHVGSVYTATPEWADYLTSPYDESPFDNILETPLQGSADLGEYLTSPAVADFYDSSFGDLPLFANDSAPDSSKMAVSSLHPPTSAGALEGLIPMSPSFTPSLDPHALFSPAISDSPNPTAFPRSTRKLPTGTRKNISPESLVPIEAPTQPRSYVIPSVTSRKELPAVFAKKRARSMAFGDEEDELAEEPVDPNALPPTATEAEAIAAKRRQNTLAARRSRKRKLEYQRQLEDLLEKEQREKEAWKERALMCQAQLQSMGVIVPFSDEL